MRWWRKRRSRAGDGEWDARIDDQFPEFATLVRRYLVAHRERCRRLADWHRGWFRTTGVLVILLSMSLPFVTVQTFAAKNVLVSGFALAIAALSTMRAFYQWDRSWRIYRSHEFSLTALIARWETSMVQAIVADRPDLREHVSGLVEKLIEDAQQLGMSEVDEFFTSVAWPDHAGPGAAG